MPRSLLLVQVVHVIAGDHRQKHREVVYDKYILRIVVAGKACMVARFFIDARLSEFQFERPPPRPRGMASAPSERGVTEAAGPHEARDRRGTASFVRVADSRTRAIFSPTNQINCTNEKKEKNIPTIGTIIVQLYWYEFPFSRSHNAPDCITRATVVVRRL